MILCLGVTDRSFHVDFGRLVLQKPQTFIFQTYLHDVELECNVLVFYPFKHRFALNDKSVSAQLFTGHKLTSLTNFIITI